MALTQEQLDVLADRSKLIFLEKDEEKRSAEIIKATAIYDVDMGAAYQAVTKNLQRYEQLAAADKGIDPATANFVVASGAVNVSASTGFNTATGYTGSTAEILVGTPLPDGAGASLAVGGGASVNDKNKVTGGYLTAQYVGNELVNDPGVPVKVLPIVKPTVVMGADGNTKANVLAGVVTAQNNGFTHTDAAIVGHDGNTTLLHRTAYRVKEPFDVNGLDTSVYAIATAKVYHPKTGVGVNNIGGTVGVMGNQNIGNGNSIYGDVNITASNMENGVRDLAIGVKAGMVFGGAPAPAKDKIEVSKAPETYNIDVIKAKEDAAKLTASDKNLPEAERASKAPADASSARPDIVTTQIGGHNKTVIQPQGHEQPNTIDAQNKQNLLNEYNAMSDKQRDVFVTRMAEFYQGGHPEADLREIKDQIALNIVRKNDTLNIAPEVAAHL